MKTNKIFGVKSITNLIYGLIVLLPMFAIFGRTIYVQANPNAKDSYSGQYSIEYKYQSNEVNDTSDLVLNNIYYVNFTQLQNMSEFEYQFDIVKFNYFWIDVVDDLGMDEFYTDNILLSSNYSLHIYSPNAGNFQLWFYVPNGSSYASSYVTFTYETRFNIEFIGNLIAFSDDDDEFVDCVHYTDYNEIANVNLEGTLDNAFEYSLSEFTKDNNLGEVDMFGWFTNMFLDTTNAKNQLYVGFVNWYLNYTMLVSSGYLLFLVLIWFINFIRRIMDKSMYQDYGGF